MLEHQDEQSLDSLFTRAESHLDHIPNDAEKRTDESILELIQTFELCQRKIQNESLFSKNEEIDDVPTSSIRYLSLPFYLAKAHGQVTNLYQRKSHLLVSKQLYDEFLRICKIMRITKKEDLFDEVSSISMYFNMLS